jgi:hypothetical protein
MVNAKLQARLQPIGRTAATYVGLATPGLHMTPSFLICGAQRCGTTSMFQALRRHPAVLRPALAKGVHYFDTDYARGMNWYRAHFPFTAHAALRARRSGQPGVTYESSPYYLFHPLVAGRIARDLPEVKVITLLRDPVERAYSAFTHERARGFETETFERALELEDERLAGEEARLIADPHYVSHAHQHQAYVHRGFYFQQVRRMVEALGPERVHVVDADDFFTNPEPVYNGVVDFLGLPREQGREFRRHNARPRSAMSESLRRELGERFVEADQELAQWWGRTPSWRRNEH